jgi:hypothetical protein
MSSFECAGEPFDLSVDDATEFLGEGRSKGSRYVPWESSIALFAPHARKFRATPIERQSYGLYREDESLHIAFQFEIGRDATRRLARGASRLPHWKAFADAGECRVVVKLLAEHNEGTVNCESFGVCAPLHADLVCPRRQPALQEKVGWSDRIAGLRDFLSPRIMTFHRDIVEKDPEYNLCALEVGFEVGNDAVAGEIHRGSHPREILRFIDRVCEKNLILGMKNGQEAEAGLGGRRYRGPMFWCLLTAAGFALPDDSYQSALLDAGMDETCVATMGKRDSWQTE